MLRCLVVLLSCSAIAESFSLEPVDFVEVKDFDGVRSYPVLMVSNNSRKRAAIKPKKQRSNEHSDAQSEITDNVREFEPMSREDIKKMKRLSFHGLSPPSAAKNATRNNAPQAATQVDYLQRKYTQQQRANANRRGATSQEVQSRSFKKPYKGYKRENRFTNTDNGFMPLMRPSPINLHPADPPSFATTRNYVDYLKMRQKKFFSEFEDEKLPSENKESSEIGYFVQRERELADEQRPTEGEIADNADVEFADSRNADIDKSRDYASREEDEEESKRHESFVPFRMYAQVRHVEAENHKPRSEAPEPQVKEKLSLEKKNVYYKEEGYEEKDYDHGDEKVMKHFRVRREIGGPETKQPIALAIVAKSNLSGRSGENTLKQLDELLKNTSLYLPDEDDAIDNIRTRRVPLSTIYGTATNYKSHKYPYYNLPDTNTLNTMSAFRYSENMKNFPRAKESLYNYKNVGDCIELDEAPEPVPSDIEEEGKGTSFNKKPQRLNGLGDKIKCYKDKFFGKDPFDNPLFQEKYVASAIPISYHDSSLIPHQANPLITVYDDVISNIRAAFADELKKQKEEESLKAAAAAAAAVPAPSPPEQVPASSTITKTAEFRPLTLSSAATVSRLPIFDINNFYPKIKVPIYLDDDDDDEATKPVKKSISKDYEMEFLEVPIKKKVSSRDVLDRSRETGGRDIGQKPSPSVSLRPPNPTPPKPLPEKRRRRNPTIPVSRIRSLSISPFYKPPQDKYKFKLL